MQGCLSYRKPNDTEIFIFVGNGNSVEVEAIGTFRLLLGTGHYLDLKNTFVVPSFRQNLVSISLLDKFGYYCSFGNNQFNLSLNSNVVGAGSLCVYDNLYLLDTIVLYNETLHVIVPEEQTQQTQEQIPLKRSTRERRNAILDDYIVFLQ
ncbi:hypothetical protein ACOSQ2_013472 [Xanthoceras sorbifolium]